MSKVSWLRVAPVCVLLSGCGGGGNDSGGSTPPPPPAVPTLAVKLSSTSTSLGRTDGASETATSFDASHTGTTTSPVYPDVQYDKNVMTLQGGVAATTPGNYRATFKTKNDLLATEHKGTITFRLCQDTQCSVVYPGSTQSFNYTLNVKLADWQTFQRNAAHTGFVNARYSVADFKKAWEWKPTNVTRIKSAATKGSTIYVTVSNADGTSSLQALNGTSGVPQWSYNLGSVAYYSAPATNGNRIHVAAMFTSSGQNPVATFDADTGRLIHTVVFASQWSDFSPPTPYGNGLYLAAGYYGNVVYGYDMDTGTQSWTASSVSGGVWDGQSPAVDKDYVYYYAGRTLDVFNRATGALAFSMADPLFASNGYDYYGGPILGSKRNVIAFSGHGNYNTPRPLVNYSLETRAQTWRSADAYAAPPAIAKGIIYAVRNTPERLNALDEESGAVKWFWTPPLGEQFIGNVVVTDNLIFVSTNAKIYAIPVDGANHDPVWSADTPGDLVISPGNVLIVTKRGPTGYYAKELVAYSLR